MKTKTRKAFLVIDSLLLVYSLFVLIFIKDETNNLGIIGCSLIAISIYGIVKARKNPLLLVLFSLVGFINISIGYKDFLMLGEGVSTWQSEGLRSDAINIINAKCLFLTICIINFFIRYRVYNFDKEDLNSCRKRNKLIAYSGLFLLYLILLYSMVSINDKVGQYQSVENPIYEYCLIIYIFVWFYSRKMRIVDLALVFFSIMYVIRFALIGDRSSMFMMVVLVLVLYLNRLIKLRFILPILLLGIPIVNFIGIFRVYGFSNIDIVIKETMKSGYYVDTISWAYYAGLAVSSLRTLFKPLYLFVSFVLSWFSIDFGVSDLNNYAVDHYPELYNNGGGLYSSFFYAFGGYLFVALGAIVLGYILKKVLSNRDANKSVFKIALVVYAFRWYLYNPSTLFKGCLIYTGLVYLLCCFINHNLSFKRNAKRVSFSSFR